MRAYELVVLLHPDLEIDLDQPLTKVRSIIKDNGGEITKEDHWGKRKLAYSIRNEEFAVYVYLELNLPGEAVKRVQGILNITDEVLRYLLTAVDPRAAAAEAEKKHREETNSKEE